MKSLLFTSLIIIWFLGCQRQASVDTRSPDSSISKAPKLAAEKAREQQELTSGETQNAAVTGQEGVVKTGQESDVHAHEPRRGRGPGRGMGRGFGAMGGMRGDMTVIHSMFDKREKINRTVKDEPNGAVAITESDDVEIAGFIQEHVPAMESRVLDNKPLPPMTFHPIFVELIKHADRYSLTYDDTEKGVKATYTAEDPYVVMLVQEHARLVSRFLENGMSEIHNSYTLPAIEGSARAKSKAIIAKEALFARLSARLTDVIQSAGAVAAIEVCSREASSIAREVGEEHGVRIGRTSRKIRNPKNAPPAWVATRMSELSSQPQFVDLPDDQIGAILPIKLKAKCTTCHGSNDTINEDVRVQISKLYPNDEATGFKEGDLRGWFWVEVAVENEAKDLGRAPETSHP